MYELQKCKIFLPEKEEKTIISDNRTMEFVHIEKARTTSSIDWKAIIQGIEIPKIVRKKVSLHRILNL